MGIMFETTGLPPITGRVFAYLLLSDPPYQDFYSLQEFIKASKSSISNALKNLMDQGYVDYITFSGDRKRYFRVNLDQWLNKFKASFEQFKPFSLLLERILQERDESKHPEFHAGLEEILSFFNYLGNEYPKLLENWEKSKKASPARSDPPVAF